MASERSLEVLRAIVSSYVNTRDPIGSKAILENGNFSVSAATIRNDMAQLEEEELIVALHTSSGRIPTDKGYRVFVDQLASLKNVSKPQLDAIKVFLDESEDLDDLLFRSAKLLSELTHQLAVVQYPQRRLTRVQHVELVFLSADRLQSIIIFDTGLISQKIIDLSYIPGEPLFFNDLFDYKEFLLDLLVGEDITSGMEKLANIVQTDFTLFNNFSNAMKQHALASRERLIYIISSLSEQLKANKSERILITGTNYLVHNEIDFGDNLPVLLANIEQQLVVLQLFDQLRRDIKDDIDVRIGSENSITGLSNASVITTAYQKNLSDSSKLGVLGPTRMDYSTNISAVRAVAGYLSRLIG